MNHPVFIAACSPRKGGNCDAAAGLLLESFAGSAHAERVADISFSPCVSCGYCQMTPGRCSREGDGASGLFARAEKAPATIVVSPVYFYHLPAQAKAWVDRAQAYWLLPDSQKPAAGKVLTAVLIGARPRGEKLFAGVELTLRYMAGALGMVWHPPLLLYGLDERGALMADAYAQESIRRFAGEMRDIFSA